MEYIFSYYLQVSLLTLILVNHLFEIYLHRRQLNLLADNRTQVPDTFKDFLTLDEHQKSIRYSETKLQFSQFKLLWKILLLLYWFPFRGAENLYTLIPFTGLHREVLFILSFGLIQTLLNIPWSLYSTFVIEEKFGFNKTNFKLYLTDLLKGLFISSLIGIPLLYLIFTFYSSFHFWWLISFLVVTTFQFILIILYPRWIAPLFNKFTKLDRPQLREGIESLAKRAGLSTEEIFVMDASRRSSHGNAYFTGLGKNKRVVFFDTLLKTLNDRELLAILAHELGHMKLKHILKGMLLSLTLSFVAFFILGLVAKQNWFYTGHFLRVISPGALLFIFMEAFSIYTFWLTPLSSIFSRKNEYEADAYASQMTNPEDLIQGLVKLYRDNAGTVINDSWYSGFYHSHPPALQRIQKLESFKSLPREALP